MPLAFPGGCFLNQLEQKGKIKMKIHIQKLSGVLAVCSAALFLSLAACSPGGDDDDYTPAPLVSVYSGVDASGSIVKLTITADGAKALVLSGSYTLEIDGELVSAGRVSTSGGEMIFTSTGGKIFTAASDGSTPPILPTSIPKDDGTIITVNVTLSVSDSESESGGENDGEGDSETDEENDGESDNPAILVEGVQVYNPDGTEFTGDVNEISHIMYLENGYEKLSDESPAGKIKNGKLLLNPVPPPDADNPSPFGADPVGNPKFFNGADYIDLSLLKPGIKTESFFVAYFWQDASINEKGEGPLYEKGWHFFVETHYLRDDGSGNTEAALEEHPLEWFYDNGYKWIYNPNPLEGTWKNSSGSEEYVFSGNRYTESYNGVVKVSDTFTLSGDVFTLDTSGDSCQYRTRGNHLKLYWIGIHNLQTASRQ
jgi:hypothetical protein